MTLKSIFQGTRPEIIKALEDLNINDSWVIEVKVEVVNRG